MEVRIHTLNGTCDLEVNASSHFLLEKPRLERIGERFDVDREEKSIIRFSINLESLVRFSQMLNII